ncbi:hypothetical protein [Streptomyces sp. NBC_01296]|uniref:hypothetical protein n=1 Tax=Streptomyces sp. NBC_01296 TaxID=2903816 RepID=UPI002E117F76|nr:hypothetical protein OG299_05415 [Streptomyces sp. NBC_01296]
MTTHAHGAEVHGPEGPRDCDQMTAPPPAPAPAPASGGEPACLLHLVCPDCGRLATGRGAPACSHCGSPLPDPGP